MEKILKFEVKNKKVKQRSKIDFAIFAVICIAIGMIFLGRNTGNISEDLFKILISWQMLLVVLGLYSVSHRGFLWGMFVACIGLFFMIPKLITGAGSEWISTYWPLIFVFIGLLFLLKLLLPKQTKCHRHGHGNYSETDCRTENGFVYSSNSFGETKHVVMDEVFRGAEISNTFGATVIDLRRTTLQAGETFIDIDCSFGAIEIFLPDNWLVLTKLKSVMSGVSDERYKSHEKIDESSRLILRGKVAMGGIVLKN